jgi:choline-sulfatase
MPLPLPTTSANFPSSNRVPCVRLAGETLMPNVVMLISDEHNPFFSGPWGNDTVQTPNMDRLATMGTVYENTYCPSPLCLPSRSAFFAGKYVHEIQTYSNCGTNLCPDHPSYGGVLNDQGVHTTHIGKVHAYTNGVNLGFSEMHMPWDTPAQGDALIRRKPLHIRDGAERRAEGYGPVERSDDRDMARDGEWTDRGLQWLDETMPRLDSPWVLSLNLVNPHFPHYVTPELWDMYPDGDDLPTRSIDTETGQHPYMDDLRRHFRTELFTEEQVRGLRRGYRGCITELDRQIGRVMDALETRGILDDTVFVYTSDHGDMLGEFGMWWKCTLLEDSARIPLIVAGPGFGRGERVRTPVSLLDVQASLFHATGVERPSDWRGEPLQTIPANDSERAVFAEYHGHGTRASAFMIRKGDWKLIWNVDAPHQLFNLLDDPGELTNQHTANPSKARELEGELRAICNPELENERANKLIDEQLRTMGMA